MGVPPSASARDIQQAFRRLALEYHPDVNRNPEAEDRFQEINAAYQVLRDPVKRSEYDAARDPRSPLRPHSATDRQGDVRRYYFQRRVRAATDPGATWNYYDVLGVPRNATEDTVARAYQRLYAEFYPRRVQDPGTEAILREIVEARDVLTDPGRRQAYDHLSPERQAPGRPGQRRHPSGTDRTDEVRPAANRWRRGGCLLMALAIPVLVVAALARRISSL